MEFHSLLNELTPAQASLPTGSAASREREVASSEVAALVARLSRAPRLSIYLEAGETRPETATDDSETDESPETNGSLEFHAGANSVGAAQSERDSRLCRHRAPQDRRGGRGRNVRAAGREHRGGGAVARFGYSAPERPRLKEHLAFLKSGYGVELAGVDFDTMLAGFLVNPGRPEPSLTISITTTWRRSGAIAIPAPSRN